LEFCELLYSVRCQKFPEAFLSSPITVLDDFAAANKDDEISHTILILH